MTPIPPLDEDTMKKAALRHVVDDVEESILISEMATALALKTGISLTEAYELLAKIGMYMVLNPGVKNNGD